jgi:hypothetical protein
MKKAFKTYTLMILLGVFGIFMSQIGQSNKAEAQSQSPPNIAQYDVPSLMELPLKIDVSGNKINVAGALNRTVDVQVKKESPIIKYRTTYVMVYGPYKSAYCLSNKHNAMMVNRPAIRQNDSIAKKCVVDTFFLRSKSSLDDAVKKFLANWTFDKVKY